MSNPDVGNQPSNNADKSIPFNGKIADIYGYFEKQHFHPDGPFPKIIDRVIDYDTKSKSNFDNLVVVDLASGHGEPARSIATALPTATIYSTDISEAMNAIATEKSKDIPNIQTKIADMQDLNGFNDNSVDVITCCYGFRFPPDKKKAVQEAYRILKPGGMIITATWNHLPHVDMFSVLSQQLSGKPYLSESLNPLSLAPPGLFEQIMIDAGFDKESVESTTHQYPIEFSNDPDFHITVTLAMDFGKVFQSVDTELLRLTFVELTPTYLKTEEDGTLVSVENPYKLVVAFKPDQ